MFSVDATMSYYTHKLPALANNLSAVDRGMQVRPDPPELQCHSWRHAERTKQMKRNNSYSKTRVKPPLSLSLTSC